MLGRTSCPGQAGWQETACPESMHASFSLATCPSVALTSLPNHPHQGEEGLSALSDGRYGNPLSKHLRALSGKPNLSSAVL